MKPYLLKTFLISAALFWSEIFSKATLNPQGNESVCPNSNISRTLTCTTTTTILKWEVNSQESSTQTYFYTYGLGGSNSPYETSGITMEIIAGSSSGISSQLIIPNMPNLVPIEIRCADSESPNGQTYVMRNKEPPDPPSGITLERTLASNVNHIIRWTTSSSEQVFESVDNYSVSVTNARLSSVPSRYIVFSPQLSLQLNYNTIYAVSVVAVNCAGSSAAYSTNIITEDMPAITTVPITTSQPTTDSFTSMSSSGEHSTASIMKGGNSTNERTEHTPIISTLPTTTPQALLQDFTPWLVGVITVASLCFIFNIISFVIGFLCGWKQFCTPSSNKYSVTKFNNGRATTYRARNAAKNDQFMV